MDSYLYTVWSTFGVSEDHEELERAEAVIRYGERSVTHLEMLVALNPGRTASLRGTGDELLVAFTPGVDGARPGRDGAGAE